MFTITVVTHASYLYRATCEGFPPRFNEVVDLPEGPGLVIAHYGTEVTILLLD